MKNARPKWIRKTQVLKSVWKWKEYIKKLQAEITALKAQLPTSLFGYDDLKRNDTASKYYSGFSYQKFDASWSFLSPEVSQLPIWQGNETKLCPGNKHWRQKPKAKDQLFLTLTRLRGGYLLKDLTFRTGLSEGWISQIIITWIQFVYVKFKYLNIFPSGQITARKGLPACFEKFQNIRLIIDRMEINMRNLQDYREQGNTYSAYKSHNTYTFFLLVLCPQEGFVSCPPHLKAPSVIGSFFDNTTSWNYSRKVMLLWLIVVLMFVICVSQRNAR